MFDADRFIECIRARPTLWDVQLQSYGDKIERDRTWQDLGQLMYPEWHTLDDDKAESKVREMKNKWRNIRDNYLKYINQCSYGAPTPRRKRKYVYADKLTFLQNTVGKRRVVVARQGEGDTSGNGVSLENDDNDEYINPDDELEEGGYGEGEYVEYDDEDVPAKLILPSATTVTEPAAPMCLLDLPEAAFAHHAQTRPCTEYSPGTGQQGDDLTLFQVNVMKKLDALKNPEVEDPDKYFLMSILPDYKKLSEEEKLDFRINCLHFFRDVKTKQSKNRQSKRKH